ncbi:MAG: phosphotransferase family protein [Pseudomonadales bacterium]|nr:phosphotransferase family protein [Pseudomonadales bacterium]
MMNKRYFDDDTIEAIRSKYKVERTVDEALTDKLIRRRGEDYKLPSLSELTDRLRLFIASNLSEPFEVNNLKRLPGGGSKEMFRFELIRLTESGNKPQNLILRMNPGESIAETHRLREFQVMDAAKNIVPVPDVYWVDADGSIMGNSAMVCGFVTGVAKPTQAHGDGGAVSGIGAGFPHKMRKPLFDQFVNYLVAIHNHDWHQNDMSSFDLPEKGSTEAASLSLNHWSRVWEEDSFEEHPVITMAAQWLNSNLPSAENICLIHNDYRNGNFLFDEESLQITAILDWETARFGDFHEDLAWVLFSGFASPDENGNPLACGLASRDEFIQSYQALSGRVIDPIRLHYYTVLNLYKLAILGSASNARAAADKQSHLDVMMNFSTGLGYSVLADLYQLLNSHGDTQ